MNKLKIITTIIVPIITVLISSIALFCAKEANKISKQARDDFRLVEKLDLAPKILFQANFGTHDKIPAHLFIKNTGPIEAINVTVRLLELRYIPNPNPRLAAMADSADIFNVPNLSPGKHHIFNLPNHWNYKYFYEVRKRTSIPIDHFIIEAFISYSKDPERKLFNFRSFYFFDKDGNIISETSIKSKEEYKEMLEYIYKTKIDKNLIDDSYMQTDILHSVHGD